MVVPSAATLAQLVGGDQRPTSLAAARSALERLDSDRRDDGAADAIGEGNRVSA